MQKRRKRITCKSKKKHKTITGAKTALSFLRRKDYIASVYKCKRCGFYHLGKPSYLDSPSKFWYNIEKRIEISNENIN